MGELQDLNTRQLYLSRNCHQGEEAEFVIRLKEELLVRTNKKHFLDIKRCVLPRVRVNIPPSYVNLNESADQSIPQLDIAGVNEVVDAINERLTSDFTPLEFLPADSQRPLPSVRVILLPGQSIRVSPCLADLLFEDKQFLRNNLHAKVSKFTFKVRKDFLINTYYLTCGALERLPVGTVQLPLVNSLSVNYRGGETHSNLTWETDGIVERAYFKPGFYRELRLRLCDGQGKTVKLNQGILFLHLRVCI